MQPGIVHLGLGAFARAHTAVYTEDAMLAAGDFEWGIVGVTQRSDTVARQLAPQDGLFTVVERGEAAGPLRVVSSIVDVISGRDNPDLVVERIAAPATRIVTLTITEKGYRFDPQTRTLDLKDPEIQADLAGRAPHTAIGQIVRGLQQRSLTGAGPVTVVSCDNLPGNGELTGTLVRNFAGALPAPESEPLLAWLPGNATFPSTMVDRMVPATTPGDLDGVEHELGLRDEAAVVAETFKQWVIEDNFAAGRPRWEDAGAVFSSDVANWEAAKLRLLNASHSMLAYLGLAAGKETISDAVAADSFRSACRRMLLQEALPSITLPAGLDGEQYCDEVLRRFANPALGHTTAKVGSDGSQKIGLRLLPTIRGIFDAGRAPAWAALAVAAWMHHVATTPEADLDDPLTAELNATLPARRDADTVVPALLGFRPIFEQDLAEHGGFRKLLLDWYRIIETNGTIDNGPDGLGNEINHG
ncbi:mannitol dehydrogenase family protein [Pseudarthrobacter sp. BRE9]|uniref:mannitol dehydrogenase family protein n=1 Tax=Pseudarthrobacter sp. BRE9 TaxID=2962582 RepID=UPI002880F57B|nr:mannitol dehydrogenase family protein [Pseudarthrobacter sp. BRE9]MDT0170493.1 mannitol dehydrogenase family protein [Pseudarthrobacter sp. BRE9]